MVPKSPRRQVVDVQDILTSICTKWGLLLLYELSNGRRRHGELRRAIGGVSQKMLTQTLRTLERDRLVQRTVHPIVPPRVDYALTPLGKDAHATVVHALPVDGEASPRDPAGATRITEDSAGCRTGPIHSAR
jgi:DNA-binding HxlR family transcriptional regulator